MPTSERRQSASVPANRLRAQRLPLLSVSLIAVLAMLAGCSAERVNNDQTESVGDGHAVVRVFGAASLTDAFEDLEAAFEAGNPAFDVELNLAGSTGLREQILDGAPVDVFASANDSVMAQVVAQLSGQDAIVEQPRAFAVNRLAIAVPIGNPAAVTGLADFADPDLFLGLCAEPVPCGQLAERALAAAAVTPAVDTRESDVRALLTKVEAGELDAGIVYATDVLASDEVEGIDLPRAVDAEAGYPVVVLDRGGSIDGGRAFMSFLFEDEGRRILTEHGFGTP